MSPSNVTCIVDPASATALFATLMQQAKDKGVRLRPAPPEPTTCCGRGCNGCIWEGFFAAANFWREDALIALQTREIKVSSQP
ncbi:MAG: hypothetical protein ACI9I0_002036 [Rhodoferax sp.]|jgi:hypothetical protein